MWFTYHALSEDIIVRETGFVNERFVGLICGKSNHKCKEQCDVRPGAASSRICAGLWDKHASKWVLWCRTGLAKLKDVSFKTPSATHTAESGNSSVFILRFVISIV